MTSQNKKNKPHLLIRSLKYLLSLLVALYVLIWILSPFAARHFATDPLQEMGVSLGETSTVRFNPFTSTLTVNDFQLYDQNKKQVLVIDYAEVSVHLHRLILKQLYVSEFLIEGTAVEIVKTQQQMVVAGVDVSASSDDEQNVALEEPLEEESTLDFTLVIPELQLKRLLFNSNIDGNPQTLLLNDLLINNASLSQLQQQLSLTLDALVNGAPMTLESEISLHSGAGSIDSDFSLEQLDLSTLSPMLIELGIGISGEFSLKGNPKVKLAPENIQVESEQIVLSLTDLDLNYAPWIVEGASDVITIDNLSVSVLPNGAIEQLTTAVTTQLSQGNVGLQTASNSVVNWDQIKMTTDVQLLEMQPSVVIEKLDIDSLNLSEDKTLSEPAPILSVAQLSVSDIQFSDNHMNIDTVSIAGLKTDIKVNPDKSIVSMVDTSALTPDVQNNTEASASKPQQIPSAETTEQVESTPEDSTALTIAVAKLLLSDTAHIQINDQSVSPAFVQNISIETLQAGPFDSRDNSLESRFELVAKDDNYLKIEAKGHARPFADKLNALFSANINELDLPSVSPYVKDGLGFEMKTGQLDVGVEVTIEDGEIDGETKLFLRGVDMSSADEVEQGTLKEGKAMPLNYALGLLKDDQGNINLGVPLRGNVAEPSFGVESFLGLVLKKAAMSQAKSYLMTTFVPYASVVSVAISGAEYLLKVKFEPLMFQNGIVELTEENQQYLSELVLLMQDKSELQLKTCAIGTFSDLGLATSTTLNAEQQATLKAMGTQRQNNLKRYLIEQDIASSRILFCAPELDTAADAQARIELKTD
ncbi:DUF748 domain-containing protein [Paraglaciecola arctica]|uniref:DUF748 domain-containing protein n=1 Tax=Paraglaciecola arctica TaxID=1128911 RepID=UPI001C07057A|nr:DUF748 domain-containing protein [Paraglaciecola arctica]MBU3003523.1 DUF748 domain-containing protein [Paraglaciecola arctica]